MLNEQLLDESIIPMNMRWRAGIGKDIQNSQQQISNFNQQNDLYDGGIKLTRVNEPIKYPYVNIDLTEQLIPEIDIKVSDILKKYNNKKLDGRTLLNIKEEFKRTCLNIKSKYRMYLNDGFYDRLYNQCKIAYEQNFITLKEDINALTEFIKINEELYVNPLLIYGYFQL